MKNTSLFAFLMIGFLASCNQFVLYPDQTGWSQFFLDRKGQISMDQNGQYRAQLKLELFRSLPAGSRFELAFEKFGSFGINNSVVTQPSVTIYRFRSRSLENYVPGDSVNVRIDVYEPGKNKPLEQISVALPFKADKKINNQSAVVRADDSPDRVVQSNPVPLLTKSVEREPIIVPQSTEGISEQAADNDSDFAKALHSGKGWSLPKLPKWKSPFDGWQLTPSKSTGERLHK